jgi:hypothetical protein
VVRLGAQLGFGRLCGELSTAHGVLAAAWLSVYSSKKGQFRSRVPPAELQAFWRPFLGSQPDPIVAFSNHRFAGTSSTGLRLFRDGVDSPSELNDTYSGTGTVMAALELGNQFAAFGRSVRLKRAELLTWDEAQDTNLIVIGSPTANSRLRQLPPLQQFDFKSAREEPRQGISGIVNLHPHPGEEPIYFASGHPYTSDYAILAMLPGLKPGRRILVMAGTNTYGVQALAEFVCRADLVGELLSRLPAKRNAIADFEALVAVSISGRRAGPFPARVGSSSLNAGAGSLAGLSALVLRSTLPGVPGV